MVGHHQVVVAERHRAAGHALDRRPAVAPGGVAVAIAAEGGAQILAGAERHRGGLLQVDDPVGHPTLQRLGDHLRGALADGREVRERAGGGPLLELAGRQRPNDLGGTEEGHRLLAGQQAAILEVGHLLQRFQRIHAVEGSDATSCRHADRHRYGRPPCCIVPSPPTSTGPSCAPTSRCLAGPARRSMPPRTPGSCS